MLLLKGASGAVLVDEEHEVSAAGAVNDISLSVPAGLVAGAAAMVTRHGEQQSLEHPSAKQTTILPLRLVIMTPTSPHSSTVAPQVTRLHTTATLLAAPAPLASELCCLYEAMIQQGQQEGLGAGCVWTTHWQPFLEDISLLSALTGRRAGSSPAEHQLPAVQADVAHSLRQFFDVNSMPAWHAYVSDLLRAGEQPSQTPALDIPSQVANTSSSLSIASVPQTPTAHQGPIQGSDVHPQHPPVVHSTVGQVSINEATSATSINPTSPPAAGQAAEPSNLGSSKELSAATQAHLPPPTAQRTHHIGGWLARLRQCLQLLHTGFPDPDDERVWQDTCAVTSVQTTDPVGLTFQAGCLVASLNRMRKAGLLTEWSHASNIILCTSHAVGWVVAILRYEPCVNTFPAWKLSRPIKASRTGTQAVLQHPCVHDIHCLSLSLHIARLLLLA
jgi:hypothetical protein